MPLLAVVLSGLHSRPEVSEPAGLELALLGARSARRQKVELGFLHVFHCAALAPERHSLLLALELGQNDCTRQLEMGGNNIEQNGCTDIPNTPPLPHTWWVIVGTTVPC